MFIAVALMTVHTGITETDIAAIRTHVFEEKHDLEAGHTYFDPSAEIALAWQRLEQGNFTELDVLLLRHELEELTIMKDKGYDEKYPWEYKKKGYTDGQIRKINAERIKGLL